MKIKQKLYLGIGLLFLMIAILTVLSTVYINKLSKETKNILVANYNTIDYSRNMLIALNDDISIPEQQALFEANLKKQLNNISEVGELELTDKLAKDFVKIKVNPNDLILIKRLRADISDIMFLNMQAIVRKNKIATNTADSAISYVSIVGVFCFLLAFILLFNIPDSIADPIKELSNSIKEIAAENYHERVHFESHDEFGDLAKSFNSMAKKLEEYKASNLEKLFIEKKRIETLINNMDEPVLGLDDTHKIVFMNNNALKITGLKIENVLGHQIQDIAVRNDLIRSLIIELFNPQKKHDDKAELVKIFANGKESYFQKELIPIRIIPTGEKIEILIGNVILLKNITEYKELDLAKTNFVANISHELKTPISSIKMSLQLLENEQIGSLNGEQINLINGINEDANRLLKITKELLNITEVESGIIQLTLMPIPVSDVIEYALNATKNSAEQKNILIKIEAEIPSEKILADSQKMAWVLTNLISNAIRYSYENSTITVNVINEKSFIKIEVIDTGQGIPEEYISKIFDRYFRIPGSKKEGTGLGLSISKEFVEAQGGKIEVISEYAKGSTFSVYIPSIMSI